MEQIGVINKEDETLIDFSSIGTPDLCSGQNKNLSEKQLSSQGMKSVVAICDAFLPSIAFSDVNANEDVTRFYLSSASTAGTPQRVGKLIAEKLQHPSMWRLRIALWLLSTWIGTLIFCGRAAFSAQYPYLWTFPEMSQKKREEILLCWSVSYFRLLRMFYKSMKLLVLFVFFSQIDEKTENLSWKAIGYPGPDPDFQAQTKQLKTLMQEEDNKQEAFGPLYKGLVNLNLPRLKVAESLRLSGFSVSVPRQTKKANDSFTPSLIIRCDAVVVGSGSGGGVVAGVLANAGFKVVVLEKGEYFARNNLSLIEGISMEKMYHGGGMMATEDMGVVILAGSTVGGGSTINWSASIKTPQHVIKEWSNNYDLELFESKLYKEAMDVVCKKMQVQSEILDEGFNNAVLRKGCEELGYPVNNIPRNSTSDHYCGWCSLGCKDGKKKGTCETWLMDLMNSGNGVILPGCEAVRVIQKRKKGQSRKMATGVAFEFECNGKKDLCVVESKATIVACGALCTPALLRKSGLKNANIGKNLHLHPVTMAWGYFPEEPETWPEKEKKSYSGGIMTAMSTVVANFNKSGYGAVIQTPSLHPGMFSAVMPWVSGEDMKRRMSRFSRTAHIFALARDKAPGTVNSPSSISYGLGAADEENLQKGIEKLLRILAAAGAEEIGTHHCKGKALNVKKASYHEFERFVKAESSRPLRDLSSQIFSAHQMGSCRMGINPKDSVVNQMGETWEVEGLYLADTSVFPTALGVNPMVTVQAIAYCTAQSVLQVLRRKKS